MPIEIKELLIRTIWGSATAQNTSPADDATDKKKKAADSAGETVQDLNASIKKMMEQTQER